MNKVLNDNMIIIFIIIIYYYKSQKLECQKEKKKKKKKEMENIDDDEGNVNEDIILQDNEHNESMITLSQMKLIKQDDEYDEHNYYFGSYVMYYHF